MRDYIERHEAFLDDLLAKSADRGVLMDDYTDMFRPYASQRQPHVPSRHALGRAQ